VLLREAQKVYVRQDEGKQKAKIILGILGQATRGKKSLLKEPNTNPPKASERKAGFMNPTGQERKQMISM
jgi:hypothetical protein